MSKNNSNARATSTGTVVEEKASIVDHVVVGAADGWNGVKAAATSPLAKELGKTALGGVAMGLGLGVGLLIVDATFN